MLKVTVASLALIAFGGVAMANHKDNPSDNHNLPDLPDLGNGIVVNNGELSNNALSYSGTLGATFSTGAVSTPDGLNNSKIQAVGITETNGAASGVAVSEQNLNGTATGMTKGTAVTDSTSFSGSMVNGTGSAWNVTGGGSVAVGGGTVDYGSISVE